MSNPDKEIKFEIKKINEFTSLIQEIDKEIIRVSKGMRKYNWNKTDTRWYFLILLHDINIGTMLSLFLLEDSLPKTQSIDWWKTKYSHIAKEIESKPDFKEFVYNHVNKNGMLFIKYNYLIRVFSLFESTTRNLFRAIGKIPHPKKKGFEIDETEPLSIIIDGFLIKYLSLRPKDLESINLFKEIRNSIHNSGIYFSRNKRDKSLQFNGIKHPFKNGCPVNFIDWELLKKMTIGLIKLFEIIINNPKIKSINEIKDPASEISLVRVL